MYNRCDHILGLAFKAFRNLTNLAGFEVEHRFGRHPVNPRRGDDRTHFGYLGTGPGAATAAFVGDKHGRSGTSRPEVHANRRMFPTFDETELPFQGVSGDAPRGSTNILARSFQAFAGPDRSSSRRDFAR